MYFITENKNFYKLSDLIDYINRNQLKYAKVEWRWDYIGDDNIDTLEGIIAQEYGIELYLLTEGGQS